MIEPVTIGRARLYLADCREVLGGLSVDHIISDPPYEDELHNAVSSRFAELRNDGKAYASQKRDTLGFNGINDVRAEIAAACVAASHGWLILFTLAEGVRAWRDDIQAAKGKWDTCLAWVKPDSSPRFNGQGAARGFECAITAWCGTGYRKWNGGGKRGVYTVNCNGDRPGGHPTEKPLRLMRQLVADYTQPGQTICDPFMGSGTTGCAAIIEGREFIGVEQDPHWFEVACKRIEDAQRQGDLFLEGAA